MGVHSKGFVPPPKPANWKEMKWKERNVWNMRYIVQPQRYKRQAKDLEKVIIAKLKTLKGLKRKRWDEIRIAAWLRMVTDKQLMGFTCHAVERLNTLVQEFGRYKQIRIAKITDGMRAELREQFKKVREECIEAARICSRGTNERYVVQPTVNTSNDSITPVKGYKRLNRATYEKNGEQFKAVTFLIPMDTYLKFKAILAMEERSFPDWVLERIKKYVSMKFRRLGEIRDLVDADIDKQIPDEEMKGVEINYAIPETTSERKKEEITNQPRQDINLPPPA